MSTMLKKQNRMKIYYIGRDESVCDIVIDDPSNITSGRHAVLKIDDNGRYTVLDCSTNGTYVNGIRIEPNVEVSVTRKDDISFAHVVELDWGIVENPAKKRRVVLLSSATVAVLAVAAASAVICLRHDIGHGKEIPASVSQCDTLSTADTLDTHDELQKPDTAATPTSAKSDRKKHSDAVKTPSADAAEPDCDKNAEEKQETNEEPIAPTF